MTPKEPLPLKKNPTSFNLVIPREVEAKIRHLCTVVHDVEWSGTLFYTVAGSLDDGTFEATCVDICVMDIGTGGFTNFNDTSDIIDYRISHGLLRPGVYEGLIHSHNNMAAFFSGVDVSTLIKEGSDLNHFLSLIVCNAGQYVARITRKLKEKVKAEHLITYTGQTEYKTFEDANVVLSQSTKRQETKTEEMESAYIEYFELNIHKTEVEDPFQELNQRLIELKKGKNKNFQSTPFIINKGEDSYPNPIPYRIGSAVFPSHTYAVQKEYDPNQTSLDFEGHEGIEQGFSSPLAPMDDEDLTEFYQFEEVPSEIIESLCTQLLTSSILYTSKSSLNFTEWVSKMDSIYEARFGSLKDSYNKCRLENWIQNFIDSMLCYSVNEDYENELALKYGLDDYDYRDSDAFIHLYACDMITFLEKLPESIVKDMMIKELMNLMPREYDSLRNNN